MKVFGVETLGVHGGLEILDRSFFAALSAREDLSVVWVTCDENTPTDDGYELWTPFRKIYGQDAMLLRGWRYALGYWQLVRRAIAETRRGPVVIHQQFVTFPALEFICMRAAQRGGVAWVLTPHESAMHHDPSGTGGLIGRMLATTDGLIALSEANNLSLAGKIVGAARPIDLVELGHLNDFRGDVPWMAQKTARERLGLPVEDRIVLFQGEVRPVKGVDDLIRAMPDVLRRLPQAYLVVAGRPYGMDADTIRALVGELGIALRVRLDFRFIPDEEVGLYFRAADAVALPYRSASQSAACFSAYAFRRPVVATAVGGLKEQVREGETGFLVEPRSVSALSAALIGILEDPARAEAMGDRARKWAGESRSWDAIASRTADVYRAAWARRTRSQAEL
jgi:glycosyltransferase involved in cell wall biosynthesis